MIIDAIDAQNNQPAIFDGQSYCPSVMSLPAGIRDPAKKLFEFSFQLLAELGVRDLQYRTIYASMPSKVCPFCGCEYFDAPGAPRHALDHYLPISKYPFSGANLRNLVPMGDRCNSAFKGQADTLINGSGQRRRCFDPYGRAFGIVTLKKSRPFEGDDGMAWEIDLGHSPEASTWDEIWHIKERYRRDILANEYRAWLDQFARWAGGAALTLTTKAQVVAAIRTYIETVIYEGFADRAFLKRAVFEMLLDRVTAGRYSDRLAKFLIDLTGPETGAAA